MIFNFFNPWKIQLTIVINFISSKDAEKEGERHTRSENIKFTSNNDASEVADELLESLRSRYHGNLVGISLTFVL